MILLEQVSYSYPDREQQLVIDEVNLSISRGEFVALIGPNGSGKSTLAKLINGLLLPTKGKVFFESLETTDKDALWQIRQKVGMVFQNPENQFVATTVYDDVAFGLENIGFPPEEMPRRIEEALSRVNMLSFQEAEPHQLSGGQKQRVAIAGILAVRPEVIIFDEATAMLDPQGRKDVLTMMQELHREGITIINITHDMEEVLIASRVILMKDGSVLRDTTPAKLFAEADILEENNLELPFVFQVKRRLEEYGIQLCPSIQNTQELVEHLCGLLSKT